VTGIRHTRTGSGIRTRWRQPTEIALGG
jgi:hypothetical protein